MGKLRVERQEAEEVVRLHRLPHSRAGRRGVEGAPIAGTCKRGEKAPLFSAFGCCPWSSSQSPLRERERPTSFSRRRNDEASFMQAATSPAAAARPSRRQRDQIARRNEARFADWQSADTRYRSLAAVGCLGRSRRARNTRGSGLPLPPCCLPRRPAPNPLSYMAVRRGTPGRPRPSTLRRRNRRFHRGSAASRQPTASTGSSRTPPCRTAGCA